MAGLLIRALALLVPFALSLVAVVVLGRHVPRPHGVAVVAWYAGICGASWLLLWLTHRALNRLLPLAVLLEMALVFPDHAPSRAQLARRAGSTRELRLLLEAPEGEHEETVQQAAERVLALVGALARHDRKTRGHAERVRSLTDLIAERMGLTEADRDRLRWAALLHDIGKLHISATLLNKDGTPSPHEWDLLKQHPEHGARIIAPLMHWLNGWGDVVAQHHERWDGTGYPRGLAGTRITLGARIVAVADAYDVMTSNRTYKKPIGRTAALRELVSCGGTQFDPTVVRAMLAVPGRRLVAALGPLSWLSGLPFLGQTTAAASTVAAQAGGALGAAAVAGAVALGPASVAPQLVPQPGSDGGRTATAEFSSASDAQPSAAAQRSPRPHAPAHHRRATPTSKKHAGGSSGAHAHGHSHGSTPTAVPTSPGSGSRGSGSGPGTRTHPTPAPHKPKVTTTPAPSPTPSSSQNGQGQNDQGHGQDPSATPQPTSSSGTGSGSGQGSRPPSG